MSTAVQPWPRRMTLARPHLALTVTAPPDRVLDDLSRSLAASRFTTVTRDATSLLTKRVNRLDLLLLLSVEWVTLEAAVADVTAERTSLVVTGDCFNLADERKRIARALGVVVDRWRAAGLTVTVGAWEATSREERREQERHHRWRRR